MARRTSEHGRATLGCLPSDGYALTGSIGGNVEACYLPAKNQIWIDGNSSFDRRTAAYAHEYFHADSCFSQPAMLHPLKNALIDANDPPTLKDFESIVEALVAIVLPVLGGHPVERSSIRAYSRRHEALAEAIVDCAKSLASSATTKLQNPPAHSLRAINFLLMHVRPFSPAAGMLIIKLIANMTAVSQWKTRWELFRMMYEHLGKEYQQSARAQSVFLMAPPLEPHRILGEALVFLSGALNAVANRPDRVRSVMPSLLGLLSMGAFFVLPVITVRTAEHFHDARIRVIHSTAQGSKSLMRSAEIQQRRASRLQSRGMKCSTAEVFSNIVSTVVPLRCGRSENRLVECTRLLLNLHKCEARRLHSIRSSCPQCAQMFGSPVVGGAIFHVASMTEKQIIAFTAAAEDYETWLLTRAVGEQLLGSAGKTGKEYEYL